MSEQRNLRRTITGIVISAKAKDTITVESERIYKHPRYKKYLRRKTKYMAHDVGNTANDGDMVEIAETRPISKRKRWRLVRIVEHGDLDRGGLSPDRELAEAAAAEEGGES